MAAVQQNGGALEHASEEMKNDEVIVMAAVQEKGHALKHASEEMKITRRSSPRHSRSMGMH